MKRKFLGPTLLLLAAIIWGVAFVAQSVGMDYVGPYTFTAVRSLLGSIVLLPVIIFLDFTRKKKENYKSDDKKILVLGGLCSGLFLCIASNLQQVGILYTTVGKAGFITSLYIVLVPIFGLVLKKTVGLNACIGVLLSVIGLYLLCIVDEFRLSNGDICMLLCAVAFAFQILSVDYFGRRVSGVKLSCLQFLVSGLLSLIPMFIFETPKISNICNAWLPIAYAGIMSCGVAYTFQILGQKNMTNTTAGTLIMSLESVVSVLAGWLLLGEILSARELAGCVIMFVAVILAQLPDINFKLQKDLRSNTDVL